MTDRTLAALRSRAERGTARDPGAIYDAALGDLDVLIPPGEHHPTDRKRADRSRARFAAAALVIAAVGVAAATWISTSGSRHIERFEAEEETFCRVLSGPSVPSRADAFVFLEPGSDSNDVARVHDALSVLPGLKRLDYVDAGRTWNEFRDLFRGDQTMLDNVEPDDLPTSFDLEFESFDAPTRAALQGALDTVDDVLLRPGFEASSDLRMIDVIALNGSVASDHGAARSGLVIGASVAERLRGVADGDPTIDATTRGDLDLMVQVMGGGTERHPTSDRVGEVVAAADRLTDLAEERCGLQIDQTFGSAADRRSTDSTIGSTTDATSPSDGG